MTWLYRPISGIVLALLLAVTSLTLADARGQISRGMVVEICSVDGLITVELDENGEPTGPAHVCPDLAVLLFADAGLPAIGPDRPETLANRLNANRVILPGSADPVASRARDPPLYV